MSRDSNLTDRQLLTWLEHQLAPGVPTNNMFAAFRIRLATELDVPRLQRAFASVVRRSDALRTVFEPVRGGARQSVREDIEGRLELVDLSRERDPDAAFRAWFDRRRQRGFDLSRRAFDAALVRLGRREVVWSLGIDHLVVDATSFTLIYRATLETYLQGMEEPLPPFADYLAHVARQRNTEQRAASTEFWRQRLAEGLHPVRFYGRADPRTTSYSRRRTVMLGRARLEALRRVSQERGGVLTADQSLAAAFIALTMAFLHRISGNRHVGVGTAVANRPSRRFRETIGLFMEMPQLRAELSEDETFASLLDQVRTDLYRVLPHSRVTSSNPSRRPAFEVKLNFQTATFPSLLGPTRTELATGTTGFGDGLPAPADGAAAGEPLVIAVHAFDDQVQPAMTFDFNLAVFERSACDRAVSHFLRLLDACIANPRQAVRRVDLLSEGERRRQLVDFNRTAAPRPSNLTAIELLEAQARATPDAVAVRCDERSLTYVALVRRVEALARRLRRLGLRADDLVAVRLDRSIEMLVALLAIWKAGAAYVPLDPSHPQERSRLILEDSRPRLLLTTRALRPSLETRPDLAVVCLDGSAGGERGGATEPPLERAPATRLAYVLFTSGSTGRPKGVEVGHPALTNFLLSMRERPGLDASDRLLALTTIAFDIAALELYLPLVVGGTVDIVSSETSRDARRLRACLEGTPITCMQATPATWRMLIDAGWRGHPDLRIVCGGEALSADLAAQLLARGSEVWNAYGPTETTVWSTLHRVSESSAAGASVPIGRPIDNTTAYVLGADGAPVPIGVEGELYLGGAGVARGYRGQPDLTRERFLPDPFAARAGARMYRTGDLASFTDDGRLHYHGRTDRQIKLRGFRVEPGEIEAALGAVPGVQQVLVVAHGDGTSGELCAYWTGEADKDALFERACAALPTYMVPAAWVRLPAFPLTSSGKVDHRALPRGEREALEDGLAPRDPIEEQIAAIWARVLERPTVPVDRDFFALGGTSMKVLETRALVEQAFGVELPIAPFFEAPATVAALASRLAGAARGSLRLLVEGRGEESPLFLIHAADGTLLPYANLARRLGGERTVYGLQPQGVEGLPMVHTRVEEMAAHYVSAIRGVQPKGPYLLGGLCVGAVIACEMARLLENEQEEVRLALFDAAEPSAAPKPHRRLKGRVDRVKAAVRESKLRNLPFVLVRKLRGFSRFEWERRADRLRGHLAMAAIRVCRGHGLPLPRWARRVPVTTVCTLAAEHYRARHVVRDEIVLFRATSGEGQDEPVAEVYADPALGWAGRSAKGVRSIDVPGGHLSMLQEPHVAVLAQRLTASLGTAPGGRRAG